MPKRHKWLTCITINLAGTFNRQFNRAKHLGVDETILKVAEHFTVDDGSLRFGRMYKQRGYFVRCILWFSDLLLRPACHRPSRTNRAFVLPQVRTFIVAAQHHFDQHDRAVWSGHADDVRWLPSVRQLCLRLSVAPARSLSAVRQRPARHRLPATTAVHSLLRQSHQRSAPNSKPRSQRTVRQITFRAFLQESHVSWSGRSLCSRTFECRTELRTFLESVTCKPLTTSTVVSDGSLCKNALFVAMPLHDQLTMAHAHLQSTWITLLDHLSSVSCCPNTYEWTGRLTHQTDKLPAVWTLFFHSPPERLDNFKELRA